VNLWDNINIKEWLVCMFKGGVWNIVRFIFEALKTPLSFDWIRE
jgi:hypothetical protein